MARPNILWILTTQWRAQACSCAGDVNARTPVLDRLAKESFYLRQAVTPHPFGPFARAALFTGVRSPANGVRDYFDPLPTTARTIAHDLTELGYNTAFFGKWHLAPRSRDAALVGEAHAVTWVPEERRGGFEFWEGFESGFLLNDPWLHGTRLPEPTRFDGYQSDVLAERAGDWLSQNDEITRDSNDPRSVTRAASNAPRPWFCIVSMEAPHPPYDAALPKDILRRTEAEIVLNPNVPSAGPAAARARKELAGYYGQIEATDRAIGHLIEAAGRDAIVVVTSVHGDMHGAHGLFRKGWPHEESVRVPLFIRSTLAGESAPNASTAAPAAAPSVAFGVSDALISLSDLRSLTKSWAQGGAVNFPLGEDAGISTETRQGFSLPQRISMPSVVALPHQCDRIWNGLRTAKRKLVLNEDGTPWLFFDLENDPFEQRNLARDAGFFGEIENWRQLVTPLSGNP